MTWPPPRPVEPEVLDRPWDPGHPQEPNLVQDHARLFYIVVDEVVDDWIGLSVALWPHADSEGRLRFVDSQPAVEVGTSRHELLQFLATRDSESDATIDPVRIGTTFGARVRRGTASSIQDELRKRAGHGEVRIEKLDALLRDPMDLTAQGRLIAKLASYSAMLSTLPTHLEKQWNLVEGQGG